MTKFWVNSKRGHFGGIWGTFAPFPGEPDFSWKIGLCYPNCIIALYHPTKFQKKLMSQSWDIEWTDRRTDETEFIGPSRKRGSKKIGYNNACKPQTQEANTIALISVYPIFSTNKARSWKTMFIYILNNLVNLK